MITPHNNYKKILKYKLQVTYTTCGLVAAPTLPCRWEYIHDEYIHLTYIYDEYIHLYIYLWWSFGLLKTVVFYIISRSHIAPATPFNSPLFYQLQIKLKQKQSKYQNPTDHISVLVNVIYFSLLLENLIMNLVGTIWVVRNWDQHVSLLLWFNLPALKSHLGHIMEI